jgi:hypothetical protein
MNEVEAAIARIEASIAALRAETTLADTKIRSDVDSIAKDVELLKAADGKFVTQERFQPVEKLVLGFAGLVLVAVVMAVIALVVRQG